MTSGFRLYRSMSEVPADFGPSALTIGNFDGLHAGHRHILARVREIAEDQQLKPSLLSFNPHPMMVVAPERAPRLMTLPDERCELMREQGIQQVVILPFTAEVARLSPEEFVEQMLVKSLGARAVIVGENFRFGHKRAGDTRLLASLGKRLGFALEVIRPVSWRRVRVSSSEIRRLVENGAVARAARLLLRPYALQGRVVHGHGVGARKTVPTLNLAPTSEVLPKGGVYVTRTKDPARGRQWESVTNVGYRPTFGGNDQLSIETFLLDAPPPAPPERIQVEFLWRLRDERKFENPEALKAQILKDVAHARAYFRRLRKWTRQTVFDYSQGESHEIVGR